MSEYDTSCLHSSIIEEQLSNWFAENKPSQSYLDLHGIKIHQYRIANQPDLPLGSIYNLSCSPCEKFNIDLLGNSRRVADTIIITALMAEKQKRCVGISQSKDNYRGNSILTYRAMKKAKDALIDAGLINYYTIPPKSGGWGLCSFARASTLLIESCDIDFLSNANPRKHYDQLLKWQDKQGRQHTITDTELSRRYVAELCEQNSFMDKCELSFDCPLLSLCNSAILCSRQRRIFTKRDDNSLRFYRLGGRMYGAGYQNCRKDDRSKILINGKQTVEEDFSQCHMVLYRTIYEGWTVEDALRFKSYEFDVEHKQYETFVHTPEDQRKFQKTTLMIMMNAQNKRSAKNAVTWELRKRCTDIENLLVKSIAEKAMQAAKIKNPTIPFYKDLGVRLQAVDAEISTEIQRQGRKNGIHVLNIHDGFIVQSIHHQWLIETMEEVQRTIINKWRSTNCWNTRVNVIDFYDKKGL